MKSPRQFGFLLLAMALCSARISAQPLRNLQLQTFAGPITLVGSSQLAGKLALEFDFSRLWQQCKPLLFFGLLVTSFQLGLTLLLALEIRKRKKSEFEIKTFNGRIISATEEERKRIARELHDDIGQRLSLVSIKLDILMQNSLDSRGEARRSLEDALTQINEIVSDLHNLTHQLHSSKLEVLGLEMALNELCKQIAQQHCLEIEFRSDNIPSRIQEEVALCFYRVAQEALNNCVKHSGSGRAALSLHCVENCLRMTIRDYGVGFDPSISAMGLGLATMKERLRLVGGDLAVHSRVGKGAELVAHASLKFPGEMMSFEHNYALYPTSDPH